MDRNKQITETMKQMTGSLSARRAWIEMLNPHHPAKLVKSLSARRAWIEIFKRLFGIHEEKGRSPQGERG